MNYRFTFKGYRRSNYNGKDSLLTYQPLKYKIIQVIAAPNEEEAVEKLKEKFFVENIDSVKSVGK